MHVNTNTTIPHPCVRHYISYVWTPVHSIVLLYMYVESGIVWFVSWFWHRKDLDWDHMSCTGIPGVLYLYSSRVWMSWTTLPVLYRKLIILIFFMDIYALLRYAEAGHWSCHRTGRLLYSEVRYATFFDIHSHTAHSYTQKHGLPHPPEYHEIHMYINMYFIFWRVWKSQAIGICESFYNMCICHMMRHIIHCTVCHMLLNFTICIGMDTSQYSCTF